MAGKPSYEALEQRIRELQEEVSAREKNEKALQIQKAYLEHLLDSAPEGITLADKNHRIIRTNAQFTRLFGYTPEETIGRIADDLIAPPERFSEASDITRKVGHGEPVRVESVRRRKDGSPILVELMAAPVLDGDEHVADYASYRDITERKRIEEALRQSEAATRRIAQENATVAEIGRIISSTTKIDEVYEGFAEEVRKLIPFDRIAINIYDSKQNTVVVTYEAGIEVQGRRVGDVLPLDGAAVGEIVRTRSSLLVDAGNASEFIDRYPSSAPAVQAGLRSMMMIPLILRDQVIGILHFRSTQPDAYSEMDLRLAEKVSSQIAGAIASAQLFAERRQAEEALRKSEEKFKKLFDEAPVGYLELDEEGRITQVNRTELAMLGYSAEEMLGQCIWKFVLEEEAARQAVMAKLSGAMKTGRAFERTYRRKDGTTLPVLIEDAVIRNSEGRVIGIHTTNQDITERKRSEKELAGLQEQLRQSQKMEAIGRLAGGIAHDFNNLLTVIKGYTDLSLLQLKEGDPLWGNLREIDKASERAKDLTRQLLAFGRRQILQVKVLDFNSLLLDLEKMLHRILGEDIELLTVLAEDLGRVRVDPGEIEQVIMNLAVNARDAMSSGGKLSIETENVALDGDYACAHPAVTPGHYVRLTVSDTGVGMSREVQEKAFEPFFTTKEKGKGTGLGLSTVYGIVKQSGGNVWLYSEPGKGTTFKIYLPKVEEELDPLQRVGDSGSFSGGTERVLLVEDEAPVRDLVARFLRHQGYTVLAAADGEQAISIAAEQGKERIDLLLTDIVMPKMSGKELADRLKSLRPDLKVVFTSGYTDNAIVRHGVLEAGVNFLQKPFSMATLGRKIREVLDGVDAR
jgi:two-component system cell cycle sensor histidine kinase/response regulator CckA